MAARISQNCLNPELDLDGLQREFAVSGVICIDQVLLPEVAATIHAFLNDGMPENWWFAGVRWSADAEGLCFVRNRPENQALIARCKVKAHLAFLQNHFAHFFLRTINDHGPACDCCECAFRQVLAGQPMLAFLSRVSGIPLERPEGFFASRYQSGCFLGPHDDGNRGKLALVFNFTKRWQSSWGGLLTFTATGRDHTTRALVPGFNSLTLFAVPEGGIGHYVSHVIPGLQEKRLAISGWYR